MKKERIQNEEKELEEYDGDCEFIITEASWKHSIPCYDIEMNVYSSPLALKSLFHTDASAIFLVSLINLFGTLKTSDDHSCIRYSIYSHALTIFYLKKLAKFGVVEILEFEKSIDTETLESYYSAIGNETTDKEINMYDMLFIKRRDLKEEDIDEIKKIMRSFHIAPHQIKLRIKGQKLHASLSKRDIIKSITSGHFKEQFNRLKDSIKPTNSSDSEFIVLTITPGCKKNK